VHDALGVQVDKEEREDGTEPHIVDLQEVARKRSGCEGTSASSVRPAERKGARLVGSVEPCASRPERRASRVRLECARLPRVGSRPPYAR
jgi:hypothetical protein